jgi:hypothetical protein
MKRVDEKGEWISEGAARLLKAGCLRMSNDLEIFSADLRE